MSEALTGHNIAINLRKDGKTIDVHVRWARQEELTVLLFPLVWRETSPRSRKDRHGAGSTSELGRTSEPSETKQGAIRGVISTASLSSFLHHDWFKFDKGRR